MKCKDCRDSRRHHQQINVAAKTLEIKPEEMLPLKKAYRYSYLFSTDSQFFRYNLKSSTQEILILSLQFYRGLLRKKILEVL